MLSDEFEKWWNSVVNDEHVAVGINDRHVARLAWQAAITTDRAQGVEPDVWAISYDGKTPYSLWHYGDGPLLDAEVARQGGTCCKLALYTHPLRAAGPVVPDDLTDKQVVSACYSYRHDFGLLDKDAQEHIAFQCRQWWHAITKELVQPSQHPFNANGVTK